MVDARDKSANPTASRRKRCLRVVLGLLAVTVVVGAGFVWWHPRLAPLRVFAAQMFVEVPQPPAPMPPVAHAGGAVMGLDYTNTVEALQENYKKGFRCFELDFSKTSDGHFVGLHDWNSRGKRLFGHCAGFDGSPISVSRFKTLKTAQGLTPVTVERLNDFLRQHPDALIVTDIKRDNLEGLRYLKERVPDYATRIIPQIYSPAEYAPVTQMGYKRIIWTLYRDKAFWDHNLVIREARKMDLYAVTMPIDHCRFGLGKLLMAEGIPVYSHTVNSRELYDSLRSGLSGIYTDTLLVEAPPEPGG